LAFDAAPIEALLWAFLRSRFAKAASRMKKANYDQCAMCV
jgi:hypothetical protein